MDTRIKVSGNIIDELSDKIPSNIVAINELIKNGYDAGASIISIILNSEDKTLEIIDNGSGMDLEDIGKLLHIASSDKKYGKINEYGRLTQGSKGLGFLSVFKFGKYVVWETKKDMGYRFVVNYNDLVESADISKYEVPLVEDDSIDHGTHITILLDNYDAAELKKYFLDAKNYKKVLKIFDSDISIYLYIDGEEYLSSSIPALADISPENQIYHVTYSSRTRRIDFALGERVLFSEGYPFYSDSYQLDINLAIFHLPPHGKKNIDELFIDNNGDLTPLIYINDCLFINYDIFNPGIMKNIKSDRVLNQMIGFIRIVCDSDMMGFNSDRSQLVQNELTDSIISFLHDINMRIQEIGSEYKKSLAKRDFLPVCDELLLYSEDLYDPERLRRFINDDFEFKPKVQIRVGADFAEFALYGRSVKVRTKLIEDAESAQVGADSQPRLSTNSASRELRPAEIMLRCKEDHIQVPSEQIDLCEYVATFRDSSGNVLDRSLLTVRIDGVDRPCILHSVRGECTMQVEFSYDDPQTGLVVAVVGLKFESPRSRVAWATGKYDIISIPSRAGYAIQYNGLVGEIIRQINKIGGDEYLELVACALRSVLELSVESVLSNGQYEGFFENHLKLEPRVLRIVDYIAAHNEFVSSIAQNTGIGFHDLKGMVRRDKYESVMATANLGAHHSTDRLTKRDITDLGKMIGIFLVLVNEMIYNTNIGSKDTWGINSDAK